MKMTPMPSSGNGAKFARALEFVLSVEGGWWPGTKASDPNPTMRGVTQRVYDAWRDRHGSPRRSVRVIETSELQTIYGNYWLAAGCQHLDWPVCLIHFDTAVNSGPGNARKLGKRSGYEAERYLGVRQAFYDAIVARNPAMRPNAAGWRKRLDRLRTFIQEHS